MEDIEFCPQTPPLLGAKSSFTTEPTTPNSQNDEDADWTFWLRKIAISGSAIEHAPESIRNDRQIVLEAVTQKGVVLRSASEGLRNDKAVVMAAVRNQGHSLEHASDRLKNDREVARKAVKQNWFAIKYVSKELTNDIEIVIEAVKQDARAFKFASEDLKIDIEFIKTLAKVNGNILEFLPPSLSGDVDIITKCLAQNEDSSHFIPKHIKEDIMKTDTISASPKARIKRKLSIIKEESASPKARIKRKLSIIKEEVAGDINVDELVEDIRTEGRNLGYAPCELKYDKSFVIKAVQANPRALQFAVKEMKDDEDVVFAAVNLDGLALQYASERLRSDMKIVIAAAEQDAGAFAFVSNELKQDKDFALTMVSHCDLAMEYTISEQKADSIFLRELGKQGPKATAFASAGLLRQRASVVEELKQKELPLAPKTSDREVSVLTRNVTRSNQVPPSIDVPSSDSDFSSPSRLTRKKLARMLAKSQEQLKQEKDIKRQLYTALQKLAITLERAGVPPVLTPTIVTVRTHEVSPTTSAEEDQASNMSGVVTVQTKNKAPTVNKSKTEYIGKSIPGVILLLVVALIILVQSSIYFFRDYPYCPTCEDGSHPPDIDSCVWYSKAATIRSGSSECKAYQATFGNACGCENSLASRGMCRICENGSIPPNPSADVFGYNCLEFEFDANSDNPLFDSCTAYQDFARTTCCSSTVPSLPPSPQTVLSVGRSSSGSQSFECDAGLIRLSIEINVNTNAGETMWKLIDKKSGSTLVQGGPYPADGITEQKATCVTLDSCTEFEVRSNSSKEVFANDVLTYTVYLYNSRVTEGSYYGFGTSTQNIGDCSPTA